jgi:hypothetical protein
LHLSPHLQPNSFLPLHLQDFPQSHVVDC